MEGFRVDCDVYLVVVGESVWFLIFIVCGMNVLVKVIYDDCKFLFLIIWLSGLSNLGDLLISIFDIVGVCNGFFYVFNVVS